jgi:hypothetical protein
MKTTTKAQRPRTDGHGYAEGRKLGAGAMGKTPPNFKVGAYGDRTRMFLFGMHHSSWEVVITSDGPRLVPVLKPHWVVAGVNGTRAPRSGAPAGTQPSSADVEAKAKRQWGFTLIGEPEDYLYEVDGAGHKGIFSKWEKVRIYGDGAWDITFDQAAFDAWRWELVTTGRVDGPRDSVVAALRRAADKRVSRAGQRQESPAARKLLAAAEAGQKHLEEAIKALTAEESPRPKKSGAEPPGATT